MAFVRGFLKKLFLLGSMYWVSNPGPGFVLSPDGMAFVGGQLVKPKVPVCPVNPQTEFCNCPGLVRPNFGTDYFPPGQLVSKLDRKSGAMFTFFIIKFLLSKFKKVLRSL